MIANPWKNQVIIVGKGENVKDKYTLNINDTDIVKRSSVILIGVEIDKIIYQPYTK